MRSFARNWGRREKGRLMLFFKGAATGVVLVSGKKDSGQRRGKGRRGERGRRLWGDGADSRFAGGFVDGEEGGGGFGS